MVEKFIAPIGQDVTYYIQNYLNIFYSDMVSNTTRKVRTANIELSDPPTSSIIGCP